jgi:L-threonylcarbamoyladenylate synthase
VTGEAEGRSEAEDRSPAQVLAADDAGIAAAIDCLRRGGVVALPTDTVYGIAVALPTAGGVERLFEVKRRPPDKGIMLLLADAAQAPTIGGMTPMATALGATFWPGGLTVVVPQHADVPLPAALTGGTATIGLRVPDHPVPRALAVGVGPLPTTSANRSGLPEGRDASEIATQIGTDVDLILDGGPSSGGPASTVVDCTGDRPVILRVGAIAPEQLAAVLDAEGIAHDLPVGDLPHGLGRPAIRALARAGLVRIDQFGEVREADLRRMHGVGPKAIDGLRDALAGRGRTFAA